MAQWSKEEENYLKMYYGKKTIKELSRILNRSYNSVSHKVLAMGLSKPKANPARKWTEYEITYLEKFYYTKGSEAIAKKLNRSKDSIKRKAQSLGYNSYMGDMIHVKTLSYYFNCDSSVINRWINEYGLWSRQIRRGQMDFKLIDPELFWRWAEENKNLIPWHKYEEGTILPEPAWVHEQVVDSQTVRSHRKKVSYAEKVFVVSSRKKGMSWEEIAGQLNRTKDAVKHIWRDNHDKVLL